LPRGCIFCLSDLRGGEFADMTRTWTAADFERLRRLHAEGASVARASVALKKSKSHLRAKARELGLAFQSVRDQKARQREKEAIARRLAGLPPI
jgi:hypothetical protein